MHILTLETTCDETAAAVVTDGLEVLASVVASQDALHKRFGGVVPEIASRAHVERIIPVIDETLRRADIELRDLDAIAVANTPGLAGSLLVGLTAAKTLCLATGVPLVAINHLHAHIYACRLSSGKDVFPCVGMIVSGGHSNIYRCDGPTDFTPLGSTIDDAAGEAFDKVASLLGLPYPGGPSIEKAARDGDPRRHRFPRPLMDDPATLNFSFSGLKTAVRYFVVGPGKLRGGDKSKTRLGEEKGRQRESIANKSSVSPSLPVSLSSYSVPDVAASFQEAVVDCLIAKAELALRQSGMRILCVGGGVAANGRLRERLEASSRELGYELHIPPLKLCTDNAVMGAIAVERLRAGEIADLSLDVYPGLERPVISPSS
jgi:N6-L-threonylcarbamoyladenine synthase